MKSNSRKGKVVSFEGITGSGKTTLVQRIHESLKNRGYDVYIKPDIYSYNDSGIGRDIKKILSQYDRQFLKIGYPIVEALLIAAKRAYDAEKYLKPALNTGRIVLVDRGIDTYYAYHAVSLKNHFPNMGLFNIINWLSIVDSMGGLRPDLTIYLYLDIEKALKRSTKRDIFEITNKTKKYYLQIIEVYEHLIQNDKDNRIIKINVSDNSIEQIHKIVLEFILKS